MWLRSVLDRNTDFHGTGTQAAAAEAEAEPEHAKGRFHRDLLSPDRTEIVKEQAFQHAHMSCPVPAKHFSHNFTMH